MEKELKRRKEYDSQMELKIQSMRTLIKQEVDQESTERMDFND
jgi:hypothetical protein